MELHELHVLERHAGVVGHRHAVPGRDDRVGGVAVRAPGAAGGHDDGFGHEGLEPALDHVVGHHAPAHAVVDDQSGDEPLHVHGHTGLDGPLDHGVQHVVAGLVGPVAGARIAGAPEGPLSDGAVVEAAERAAPVVQLVDDGDGVLGHLGYGVLIGQVVGALHGVEGVLLPGVVGRLRVVGQRGVHSALRRSRMAASRPHLRQHGHIHALPPWLPRPPAGRPGHRRRR